MISLDNKQSYIKSFYFALTGKTDVTESFIKIFYDKTSLKTCKKNEFLIRKGEQENYINFIFEGLVMVYLLKDNNEYVTNFRFTNQLTSSLNSFILREPSDYSIKALVDSKFLSICYDDLQFMYENYHQVNTLGRLTMEKLLLEKRQREVDFMVLSAEERYNKMRQNHPEYILNIKQKHLASFLGITPESLSRIRKKSMG